MEEINKNEEENRDGYIPRPGWQVWGARIGAVIFAGFILLQILQIAGGGLA